METTITIDTDLLSKAMKIAEGQSQKQIIEDALRLFVVRSGQSEARKYRGKLRWEGDLDELRASTSICWEKK